jgi:hypothetical protein
VADPTLSQGQYSIGKNLTAGDPAAFVFGRGANAIQIQNTATDTGSATAQDQNVVGHDGQLFGVDTQPGMVVTQTGFAYTTPATSASALDAYSQLAGAWGDPSVRLADGLVQVLRAFYPGSSAIHRTYGRGRKIQPVYGQVYQGVVPFTSQFQSADGTWYSDTLSSITVTQRPSFRGGLTPPLTPPYNPAGIANFQQNTITNTGSLPTWPVITFTGPIAQPGLLYVNTPVSIGYTANLGQTDTLVIDTRPWARTAMLNGTTSVAGLLTGNPMIGLQVQPGATVVRFTGQDFTGQATCVISWRNAFLAIGGTS